MIDWRLLQRTLSVAEDGVGGPVTLNAVADKLTGGKGAYECGEALCRHVHLDTREQWIAFFANVTVECKFVPREENLRYTSAGLMQTWPSRFPTVASTYGYAFNAKALAVNVYNGRIGNRVGTEDGWTYRGRGWPQLTGRDAYQACGFVDRPDDLLTLDGSAEGAMAFWRWKNVPSEPVAAREAWNGGTNGMADYLAVVEKLESWWT